MKQDTSLGHGEAPLPKTKQNKTYWVINLREEGGGHLEKRSLLNR